MESVGRAEVDWRAIAKAPGKRGGSDLNVLVTGGAGLIGSHVVDELLDRGDFVFTIDNYSTGQPGNLPEHDGLECFEGSIADRALVLSAFADASPDVVVHCAASYKDPADWEEDVATSIVGTINLLRGAEAHGTERVVYLQTSLCYGLRPQEEPISLEQPLVPEGSSYAYSKVAGEHYIALSEIEYISLRLANVYGPRTLAGPLPAFYRRLTEGKPCVIMDTRRDFVFVSDVVEVIVKAVDGRGRRGPYHVSSGSDHSIREIYDATVEAMGIEPDVPPELRPRDPSDAPSLLLDPSLTEADFDWKATTPLADGVRRAVEWYRQNPVGQTYTHLKHAVGEGGGGIPRATPTRGT